MHTPSFQAFRRQYPTASLTTELLLVHENQYAVKASITVEDRLLATGLASDAVLETAEDRACTRAIQNLGGAAATESVQPLTAVSKGDVPPLELPRATPSVAPLPLPSLPSPKASVQVDVGASHPQEEFLSVDWEDEPLPLVEVQATSPSPIQLEPVEALSASGTMPSTPKPVNSEPVAAAPSSSTEPVDLSDIIAQTDVELRRLGWTVAQGREFLEKTYGKRSRHDLTDQELLEFLLYLEMQPLP